MNPLEASVLVALLAAPLYWLVQRELDKLSDPAYVRGKGVVIVEPRVLEAHSAPIGRYLGREIWGSVTFMGMQYRFDRIVEQRYRHRIGPRELYLRPGLVYVTD